MLQVFAGFVDSRLTRRLVFIFTDLSIQYVMFPTRFINLYLRTVLGVCVEFAAEDITKT